MTYAVGMVVNPKLKTPVLVVWDGELEITIHVMDDVNEGFSVGRGYFERGHDEQYAYPAEATGLPRVHLPDGVKVKNQGYGTVLYTALSLVANLADDNIIELNVDTPTGPGISSGSKSRSLAASAWWTAAEDRGLASNSKEEMEVDYIEFSDFDCSSPFNWVDEVVDIEGTGAAHFLVDVDTYFYEAADENNLILATFNHSLSKYIQDGGFEELARAFEDEIVDIEEVDKEEILALDLTNVSEESMVMLTWLLRYADVEDAVIDEFALRHQLGVDPGESQIPSGVQKGEKRYAANFASSEGYSDVGTKYLREMLVETERLRKKMGWARLADLPD